MFSLYSLEPGRSYTLAVTLDGVTDTLDFTTAEESFFVDASRYGLVADGVTDNTAKLQAALSTCPAGGTVYVPAGTYRTQSLFLQSSTTLYLEKGCTLLGGTNRTDYPIPVSYTHLRKAICNGRKVNGEFVFEGAQVAIDTVDDVEYQSLCPQCWYREYRAFLARHPKK